MTLAAIVILSALIGGMSGAFIVVWFGIGGKWK